MSNLVTDKPTLNDYREALIYARGWTRGARGTGHVFSPEHRGTMMCEGKTDSAMKSSGSGTFTATSRIMHLQQHLILIHGIH